MRRSVMPLQQRAVPWTSVLNRRCGWYPLGKGCLPVRLVFRSSLAGAPLPDTETTKPRSAGLCLSSIQEGNLVGVRGFEPPASTSRT
jgi:hypothetical protein